MLVNMLLYNDIKYIISKKDKFTVFSCHLASSMDKNAPLSIAATGEVGICNSIYQTAAASTGQNWVILPKPIGIAQQKLL